MSGYEPRWPWSWHRPDLWIPVLNKVKKKVSSLTNLTSPESSQGLVVNHSHMNAEVEPSLTDLIRPLMSPLTRGYP